MGGSDNTPTMENRPNSEDGKMKFDKNIITRMPPDLMEAVNKVSSDRCEPRSNLVRRAIMKEVSEYLSEDQRKALKIPSK